MFHHFKNIKFFKDRNMKTKEDLMKIVSQLHCHKTPPNSYVVKFGEIGDQFYV